MHVAPYIVQSNRFAADHQAKAGRDQNAQINPWPDGTTFATRLAILQNIRMSARKVRPLTKSSSDEITVNTI